MINPLKISLVGIGCLIIKGVFSDEDWDKLLFASKQIKASLNNAVFDPSFYGTLNIQGIHSHYDLGNVFETYGLLNHYQSMIQVQAYRKRRRTIKFDDLMAQNTLFPLYMHDIKNITLTNKKNSITIIEKDIGIVCHYRIQRAGFEFNELNFHFKRIIMGNSISYEILESLAYKNKFLPKQKGESLIIAQSAITDNEPLS